MTEQQVRQHINAYGLTWAQFKAFMVGQTVSSYNGQAIYWEEDVQRFVKQNKKELPQQ